MEVTKPLETILRQLQVYFLKIRYTPRFAAAQALRLITSKSNLELYNRAIQEKQKIDSKTLNELKDLQTVAIQEIEKKKFKNPSSLEAMLRYKWLDENLDRIEVIKRENKKIHSSEKMIKSLPIDGWVQEYLSGYCISFFNKFFNFSTIPMDWIEDGVNWIGKGAVTLLPEVTSAIY
ncbi:MAG: hypothetical protein CM1200mP10_24750 [Candidatus Neomarinimicrobiota bacterium]|nr:MAG: hypothetical protein CM1200mP10_24750 [Candidatus Neomarinimicrobiota bacterium]